MSKTDDIIGLRQYDGHLDRIVMAVDLIWAGFTKSASAGRQRPYPAESYSHPDLDENEQRQVAGLMRVNHAGEIAAQALYRAQALIAKDNELKAAMQHSADQEIDHRLWCELRLQELEDHISYLAPIWYLGAFGIGILAGSFGDKWNLGFLAETEQQVARHLDTHLARLPRHDLRSRAILVQMREDELQHAMMAEMAGAENLPKGIPCLMGLTAKLMTKTAYYL